MRKKVAVLMSTYNGEAFLIEQIDSILAQDKVDVDIWVRDDGSFDKTLNILERYEQKKKIFLFEGINYGVGNSFFELICLVSNEYDFYAFSDQDDVWRPNKLYNAIEMLEMQKGPALYASNQMLVDRDNTPIGIRYKNPPSFDYHQILCNNQLSGCTMVFNKQLFALLREKNRRPSQTLLKNRIHDVWVAMTAAVTGIIVFDENSLILYRQHDNNVVGVRKKNLMSRMKELRIKILDPGQRQGRSMLAREICCKYPEFIKGGKEDLWMYGYYNEKMIYKLKLLFDKKIRKYSDESFLGFAFKIVLKVF